MNPFRLLSFALAVCCGWNATAAAASVETETTIEIHRHDLHDISQTEVTDVLTWPAGWSFARAYRAGGSDYVLFLKTHTGEAQVMALAADGTIGPAVQSITLERDVTSAEIFYPSGAPVLMLTQRRSGRIILRGLAAGGTVGAVIDDRTMDALERKDLVQPYRVDGGWYLLALDRWYGGAAALALAADGSIPIALPVPTGSWSAGWSHAGFYETETDTYAVVYKTETPFGQTGGGSFGVKRVLPDGALEAGWQQGPETWSLGFTQLRTVALPAKTTTGAPAHVNALWIYQIHSGVARLVELTDGGTGETLWSGNVGAGWTDTDLAVAGESLMVVKTNEEGRVPFDYRMVDSLRDAVSAAYAGKTVGYQLAVMQSGRLIHAHAEGQRNREKGLPMRATDRMSLGSVSKMFTSVLLLKMAEDDDYDLELDDRLLDHLPMPAGEDLFYLDSGEEPHPDFDDLRVIELLTHTGQLKNGKAEHALTEPRNLERCDPDTAGDPWWSSTVQMRCERDYQNGNTGLAGFVAMALENIPIVPVANTEEWQDFNHEYWLSDILLDDVRCPGPEPDTVMAYYRTCSSGDACVDGFKPHVPDPTGFCVSNGWKAGAEDLVTLLSAMRYGKVLLEDSTALLLATNLRDWDPSLEAPGNPGSTRLGWDKRVLLDVDEEIGLTKNGKTKTAYTQVWRMPRGVDIAFLTNSKCLGLDDPCPPVRAFVNNAFEDAVEWQLDYSP